MTERENEGLRELYPRFLQVGLCPHDVIDGSHSQSEKPTLLLHHWFTQLRALIQYGRAEGM